MIPYLNGRQNNAHQTKEIPQTTNHHKDEEQKGQRKTKTIQQKTYQITLTYITGETLSEVCTKPTGVNRQTFTSA
jgi:hypothetical protein